jgi:hypothetical protein
MKIFKVTNRSTESFRDRYDGVDFEVKPGQSAQIDENAARHFFGLGLEDKTAALVRLGWLTNASNDPGTHGSRPHAMARLGAFQFTELTLTEATDGAGNAGKLPIAGQKAAA